MTIKQHGGIFGRNPTFNDLTVEGSVSVPADSVSGDAINGGTATPTSLAVNTTTALDLVHFKESVNSATATQLLLQNEGAGNHAAGLGFQVSDSSELTSFAPKAGIVLERSAANGGGILKFYNDGTGDTTGFALTDKRLEILNTGNISITNGNLVMATSGTGIDFSATSGTGTSELFSDYEEGSWTPVLTFGGASTGITYSHQTGLYTKIGNVVKFELRIRISSVGTATGDAKITGLPFSPSSSLNGYVGRQYPCNTSGITATVPVGIVYDTATIIDLYENPGSSLARLNDTDFSANDYLTITGSYTAA